MKKLKTGKFTSASLSKQGILATSPRAHEIRGEILFHTLVRDEEATKENYFFFPQGFFMYSPYERANTGSMFYCLFIGKFRSEKAKNFVD